MVEQQKLSEFEENGILDPEEAAEAAKLRYVSDHDPGIRRRRSGKGFTFLTPSGKRVTDPRTLDRVKHLAIPPAWRDVWICRLASGHLQATGRDAKGRKQYLYHPRFREVREEAKFSHLLSFARALPRIRARVDRDLALPDLARNKVLATAVRLLETTLIRVGNEGYAVANQSYGLTTLRREHVQVERSKLRFEFVGKGGKTWRLSATDRRIARIISSCQELPGQRLLQYHDEAGELHDVDSSDVNGYLREASGLEITAKDFRTWAGTNLAVGAFVELGGFETQTQAKRNVTEASKRVAARLGNTPTMSRKCYIHPVIIEMYLGGSLFTALEQIASARQGEEIPGLSAQEAEVLALLVSASEDS